MDPLSQHEAFLRAIFDAPDDDTPRLVYADFLQENGEDDRAEFIRVQIELAVSGGRWNSVRGQELAAREWALLLRLYPEARTWPPQNIDPIRGFQRPRESLTITTAILTESTEARWQIVRREPELFGAKRLRIEAELALRPEQLETLFSLPAARTISEWDLGGRVVDSATVPLVEHPDFDYLPRVGFYIEPAITKAAVNHGQRA